uniref:Uncharacterized protein n=1 Tax=Caenorhabditis japonica TaxID=281687 RepID=A0A8R1E0Y8_CAEJA
MCRLQRRPSVRAKRCVARGHPAEAGRSRALKEWCMAQGREAAGKSYRAVQWPDRASGSATSRNQTSRNRDISKPRHLETGHLETGHLETGHFETGHLETATSRNRVNKGRVVEKRGKNPSRRDPAVKNAMRL